MGKNALGQAQQNQHGSQRTGQHQQTEGVADKIAVPHEQHVTGRDHHEPLNMDQVLPSVRAHGQRDIKVGEIHFLSIPGIPHPLLRVGSALHKIDGRSPQHHQGQQYPSHYGGTVDSLVNSANYSNHCLRRAVRAEAVSQR
jgi:hypothetical protein